MNHVSILNPHLSARRRITLDWKLNFKIFAVLSCTLALFLLFSYIIQYVAIVKAGYLIKDSEKRIEALYQENKNLEINFAQTTSLENIREIAQILGYQKVESIRYIKVLDSSFATTK